VYKFLGHSNSQRTSKSYKTCYMTSHPNPQQLLGLFGTFSDPTPEKRSKRVGLLFTQLQLSWELPGNYPNIFSLFLQF
jgi:hypothetical protein